MRYIPHSYQSRATRFVLDHDYCALFMDMGLGKTVATLTALEQLIDDRCEVGRVLVIAPKSVAQNTWTGECAKWEHLRHLQVSVVMGTAAQRERALSDDADIYVINRENVSWLVGLGEWRFDCVVIDESSSFKNFQSQRWKSLWKVRPFLHRLILLTGTPAPNGLMDLWAQIKLIDLGERLGRFIGRFRDNYFTAGARSGAVVYDWKAKAGAKEQISEKISDICLSMKAEDYLEMPAVIDGGLTLNLDELSKYKKFEKDCVMEAADGEDIMAVTAVSLTNKLLQFSSGAVYDDEHTWHPVSSTKMDALADLVEQTNEPVLLFYNYQHEKERILQQHPEAVPFKGEPDILNEWNAGHISLLLCHPASVAYGLNMQQGGHIIVWFSPTWNLELYEQANARLYRQGQQKPVIIYHLVCKDTIDEAVMTALKGKGNTQDALMRYLKATIDNHQTSNN